MKVICESPHDWLWIVIHSKSYITLFLTRYYKGWKRSSITYFDIVEKPFDVTILDLWRHANARWLYYDVISIDCSCTSWLAQSWYSLVNIKRNYIDFHPSGIQGLACKNIHNFWLFLKTPRGVLKWKNTVLFLWCGLLHLLYLGWLHDTSNP